ncbi:hypothetical protein NIES4071_02640 [Calothrix sp. NIES-4071]|nr:hypothetical protein NIES4071_02640 [Calothrix sp. NIES-4071]BAZ54610.1 hypothetical protein NIES4105_02630 [Calothrix sp. NIES-4105]
MDMNQRPSNIFKKIVIAILLLISCYLIGTIILNAVRTRENYKESSDFYSHCTSNDYDLICVATQNYVSDESILHWQKPRRLYSIFN